MTKNVYVRRMKRKFKGVFIPIWMIDDDSLSLAEAIALAEIDNLDNEDGCYAMNAHFARVLKVSEDRAGKVISGMVEKGYLTRRTAQTRLGRKRWLSVVKPGESHTVDSPDGHTVDLPGPIRCFDRSHTVDIPDAINKEEKQLENKRENTDASLSLSLEDLFTEKAGLVNLAMSSKLSRVESSRLAFLSARLAGDLDDEFYLWFEKEVIGRFDILKVTGVDLADWDRHIFEKYGPAIATEAISDRRAATTLSHPNLGEVKKIANRIYSKQRDQEQAEQAAEKMTEDMKKPKMKSPDAMTVPELEAEIQKFEEDVKKRQAEDRPTGFYKGLIERYREKINKKIQAGKTG